MSFALIKRCISKNDVELFVVDAIKNVKFNLDKKLLQ